MPRRPGTSIKKEEAFTPLPEFEDPDEAIVSSWFADYESSKGNGQGDAAWLASVASAPQRSGRLGVGATLTKAEPAKEMQPLNKAARKAMNRRLRREKEEEEHALEGRLRLQKLRGTGVGSNSGSSEDGEGRAALARSGSGSETKHRRRTEVAAGEGICIAGRQRWRGSTEERAEEIGRAPAAPSTSSNYIQL
ncbi:unnamed protein product [Durusdinium trenchii]|uniref:Uncharacterized protein n=1 Tax=Durusdinium trenchii TaxID=1381693 RepID=A0ABP0KCB0_9DINO